MARFVAALCAGLFAQSSIAALAQVGAPQCERSAPLIKQQRANLYTALADAEIAKSLCSDDRVVLEQQLAEARKQIEELKKPKEEAKP